MAEYIEREAAKNAFPRAEADAFENCRYCTCLDSEQIGEILDNIPAADVGPVVRCKDCYFYAHDQSDSEGIGWCSNTAGGSGCEGRPVYDNFFCACGEKREVEEDAIDYAPTIIPARGGAE